MAKPIKIEIVGDTKSIRGAFGEVDSGIGKLQSNLLKVGGAIAATFALDKIIDFGGALLGAATDLQLAGRKISTVLGAEADDVADWADDVNESFGATATQVSLLTANMADLLKPMGFTTEAAAGMSQELVGLAPALAQWSAGQYDATQVAEILSSAILGEREQLKSLGISINQAEVDTRALAIATADGRTEVTAMDQALATQQLIFEKSTDAQAGFTSGTEDLAGQQALLRARFEEVKEYVATQLTPILVRFGAWVTDTAVPAVTRLWQQAQQLRDRFDNIRASAQPLLDRLAPLVERFRALVDQLLRSEQTMTGLKVILVATAVAVGVLVAAVVAAAAAIGLAVLTIVNRVGQLTDGVIELIASIQRRGDALYRAIVDPFRRAIDWVKDQWQGLKDTVTSAIKIPNPFSGIIPGRAMGGHVTRTGVYDVGERGRERVILPQGARVQPAHAMAGGGGDTINIYGTHLTAVDVARELAWRRRIGGGR